MTQNISKFASIAFALGAMSIGQDAMAAFTNGGTVIYAPYAQSIPTLSGSMLAVLALLFAVMAFRVLRTHSAGKPLASFVAAGVLAVAAASGNQLISNTQAGSFVNTVFMSAGGGTFSSIELWGGDSADNELTNQTGRAQQILSVTPYPGGAGNNPPAQHVITPNNLPQCVAGLIVQNNSSCYVRFACNSNCSG